MMRCAGLAAGVAGAGPIFEGRRSHNLFAEIYARTLFTGNAGDAGASEHAKQAETGVNARNHGINRRITEYFTRPLVHAISDAVRPKEFCQNGWINNRTRSDPETEGMGEVMDQHRNKPQAAT